MRASTGGSRASGGRRCASRLKELDGIDADDVIMSPDRARARGLTATVCFPDRQSCAGRLGHQEHGHRSVADRRGQRVSPSRAGARIYTEDGCDRGDQDGRDQARRRDCADLRRPEGRGMQEIYQVTSALKQLPHCKHVAVLTDARFSGVSTGACIGHISPEALAAARSARCRRAI